MVIEMFKLFLLDLVILFLEMVMATFVGVTLVTSHSEMNFVTLVLSISSIIVWLVLVFNTIVSTYDQLGDQK